MDTIYNTSELYDRYFELVEREDNITNSNGQLLRFHHWLFDNDFLRNLTEYDYEQLNDDDYNHMCLPILRNKKIGIGFNSWENYCKIGIDPSDCYNKVSSCSIIVKLPLSKREEERFYSLLNKILNKKSGLSKDWFKKASKCWYGSYATFGNVY